MPEWYSSRVNYHLAQQVTERLAREAHRQRRSQAALARELRAATGEPWPQSRVWKLLRNRTGVKLNDVEALAYILNLNPIAVIADSGPSDAGEVAALAFYRSLPLVARAWFQRWMAHWKP
jgi:hypothetical protein